MSLAWKTAGGRHILNDGGKKWARKESDEANLVRASQLRSHSDVLNLFDPKGCILVVNSSPVRSRFAVMFTIYSHDDNEPRMAPPRCTSV